MANSDQALQSVKRSNHMIVLAVIGLLIIIIAMLGYALYQQREFIVNQQAAQEQRTKENERLLKQIQQSIKDRSDYQLKFLQCLALTNSRDRTKQDVLDCINGSYDDQLILPGDIDTTDSKPSGSQGNAGPTASTLQPAPQVDTKTNSTGKSTPPKSSNTNNNSNTSNAGNGGATNGGQANQSFLDLLLTPLDEPACELQQGLLNRCIIKP